MTTTIPQTPRTRRYSQIALLLMIAGHLCVGICLIALRLNDLHPDRLISAAVAALVLVEGACWGFYMQGQAWARWVMTLWSVISLTVMLGLVVGWEGIPPAMHSLCAGTLVVSSSALSLLWTPLPAPRATTVSSDDTAPVEAPSSTK